VIELLSYENKTFAVHPALEQRIVESKRKAETAHTADRKLDVDADYDEENNMTAARSDSEDGEYVVVSGSEEFKKLKEEQRWLEAQIKATTISGASSEAMAAEVSRGGVVKGPEAIRRDYTAFVVDTNLLVRHLEVFNLIASKGWAIIIPNSVVTELNGLRNNAGPVGDDAKSAMFAISHAVSEKRDVKVITAKGSNVTNSGFFREKLEREPESEDQNIDDIIITTTQRQGEARCVLLGAPVGGAQPAILITEDTNMRVKANARGVPAISTTVLRKYLGRLGEQQKKSHPVVEPVIKLSEDFDIHMPDVESYAADYARAEGQRKAPRQRRRGGRMSTGGVVK